MKSRSSPKTGRIAYQNKLKIVIRIRPVLNEQDPSMFVHLQDNDTLQIRRPGNHSYMKFNNILPPESTQKDVFLLVQDSIQQFLKGTNTTIFAYGQTGAGKTYSIIGNYSPNENQQNLYNFLSSKSRGVLSRSLEMIMNIAGKETHSRFFVSFYEIYNEKIFDLYNYTNVSLDIRQSKNGEISIPDLMTVEIDNMQDAIKFLMIGLKNRATGSTQANSKSSRSHSIFQMSMEKQEGEEIIYSSLRIVDLAGSQKFKIPNDLTNAEKDLRIQQLTSINGSLSCLGHCISALIDKTRTHIPFRNSKLTRILSDSLLGQGKMRFIICISPSLSASAQTFSTLQFANRAKRAIFDRSDNKSPSAQKKKLQSEQVVTLKKQLQKQKEMRFLADRQLNQLKKQNQMLKSENGRLLHKLQSESHNKSQDKDSNIYSKLSHYDKNKQNDFKEQILKLTIFQKNRLDQIMPDNATVSHNLSAHAAFPTRDSCGKAVNKSYTNNNSQVNPCQPQVSKNVPVNKKKAEFQKKIRKFIQSDSPHRSHVHNNKQAEPYLHSKGMKNGFQIEEDDKVHEQSDEYENIWDTQKNDTTQFIEKACNKMNLSEFNELKSEMERARKELLNLQKKDSELQQRKQGIY